MSLESILAFVFLKEIECTILEYLKPHPCLFDLNSSKRSSRFSFNKPLSVITSRQSMVLIISNEKRQRVVTILEKSLRDRINGDREVVCMFG